MMKGSVRKHSKSQVLSLMEPIVAEWFAGKFPDITEPQSWAVPLIHKGKNVLVSSPTGSGKTLTAFLSIINELVRLDRLGRLEDRIYCVYISPLKALANDINRNLEEPLAEIERIAERSGYKMPDIRVAVRTGDTTTSERQRMLRIPPHIFITTPESLAIVLSTKRFREKFLEVDWVIVDEIHEICASKRGVLLSLTIERLLHGRDATRIGLSATQAPIREIANFLAGYDTEGKPRQMSIIDVHGRKKLDLLVTSSVSDMNAIPLETVNIKMYDLLRNMIKKHRTTLVFTNTRSGTERVAFKLRELGVTDLEPHHGSLGKLKRLAVEGKLKAGELRGVVTSTSLELGIDIGSVELVCQLGSPKSVAKALQRFGRSGHGYGDVSRGRFIVTGNDDLVECAVIARCALDYNLDRVRIPKNSLDVLAQTLVGMSLERRWMVKDALALVRCSYCYHDISESDFRSVLEYLSGGDRIEGVYSKIWFDGESDMFGIKRSSRMIYYLNAGTIPEESEYHVYSTGSGTHLGKLSDAFVERLRPRDIFLLGGKTYEFQNSRGQKVFVNDAAGRKPSVPSWTGEMLPASYDLSIEIGKFRKLMEKKVGNLKQAGRGKREHAIMRWLMKNYLLDQGCARSLLRYFREQYAYSGKIPNDQLILLEGYTDPDGKNNIIFHFCFGRRVNDLLARAYAQVLSDKYECNFKITVTDEAFMLTTDLYIELDSVICALPNTDLEAVFKRSIKDSELFRQRFRHCASRGFMLLRNYRGVEINASRQQMRASKMLDRLSGDDEFPLIRETYNEIKDIDMDFAHAKDVIAGIESGKIRVDLLPYSDTPSPFAHNVVLSGASDIILMDDRNELLKRLGRKVLEKVLGKTHMDKPLLDAGVVKAYFNRKSGPGGFDAAMLKKVAKDGQLLLHADDDRVSSFLVRVLGRLGPLTAEELTAITSIPVDGITRTLRILENEGTISSNNITRIGNSQYILRIDLVALENLGRKVYHHRAVSGYIVQKQFTPLDDIDDYFKLYGEVSDPYDIFNHVRTFAIEKWKSMLEDGRITQGRFLRGRVKYIPTRNVRDYVTVYRREELDLLDRKILSLISSSQGLTLAEIQEKLESLKIDKEKIKESVNRLDSNIYVVRSFYDSGLWAPQNRYVALRDYNSTNLDDALEKLVITYVRAYGPVSISAVQGYFGLQYEMLEKVLDALEKDKKIEKILSVGDGHRTIEYYIAKGEIKALDNFSSCVIATGNDKIRILALSDPFVQPLLPMVIARHGEGRYLVAMKGHELIGILEQWERSDRIEIKNIHFEMEPDANHVGFVAILQDVLCAIDEMMVYFGQHGYDTVAVRNVSGKSVGVLAADLQSIFTLRDYQRIQKDMMVKGEIAGECFSDGLIMNYIVWRQHIHPERQFASEVDAVKGMHGIRSNNELALRLISENYCHLRNYWRDGMLVHALAIPDYSTYCTMDDVLLYKRAKNRNVDHNMKLILNVFDGRAISKSRLLEDSPLGLGSFTDSLRDLQDGLYILKNSKGLYYATGNFSIPVKTARKAVLRNIFLEFGIFSAENLAMYNKFEWKMSELRSTLKTMEKEGFLERGYFLEGDDTLYWMVKEDLERLRTGWVPKVIGDFVLTPDDRLSHYLMPWTMKKFRMSNCFTIFQDGIMTCAFKARLGKGEISLSEFKGSERDQKILEAFALRKGLRITRSEEETDDEWDIISYVDKTRGLEEDEN